MVTDTYPGVGESDWVFRTSFESNLSASHADLVFDGLDTFAVVELASTSSPRNEQKAYNTFYRMDTRFSSILYFFCSNGIFMTKGCMHTQVEQHVCTIPSRRSRLS